MKCQRHVWTVENWFGELVTCFGEFVSDNTIKINRDPDSGNGLGLINPHLTIIKGPYGNNS